MFIRMQKIYRLFCLILYYPLPELHHIQFSTYIFWVQKLNICAICKITTLIYFTILPLIQLLSWKFSRNAWLLKINLYYINMCSVSLCFVWKRNLCSINGAPTPPEWRFLFFMLQQIYYCEHLFLSIIFRTYVLSMFF